MTTTGPSPAPDPGPSPGPDAGTRPDPGTRPGVSVAGLRCEGAAAPRGVHARAPRLSWRLAGERRGLRQAGYHVRVSRDDGSLAWDSGEVASSRSHALAYGGEPLASRERLSWRVRVRDEDGALSPWSEPASWEMGLLQPADWQADWIGVPWREDPRRRHPVTLLRRRVVLDRVPQRARAYATALGLYRLAVNGRTPEEHPLLAPGLTAYDKRLEYQVHDVTELLQPGENVLSVVLADGWYRGAVGLTSTRNLWGSRLGLLLQLELTDPGARVDVVGSDGSWRVATGPGLADTKLGESYDARQERTGWDLPGYDDAAWDPALTVPAPEVRLDGPHAPPVREQESLAVREVLRTPAGQTVLDFGQNLAGVVRFAVAGPRGTTVRLRHAESLDGDGNFTTRHMRAPLQGEYQTVEYTLAGRERESFTPRFSTYGFRYVELVDWPAEPDPADFRAVAVYSDMRRTGRFGCDDPRLDRLHANVAWSFTSNAVEVPTDCPTRERAGWTGDLQVFARTGSFLMDTQTFLERWLVDLACEQRADGTVTNTVPDMFRRSPVPPDGSAGWGDVAVVAPWALYEAYGDEEPLRRQYDSMRAWVERVHRQTERDHWTRRLRPSRRTAAARARGRYLWDTGFHWGEWLEPGTGRLDLPLVLARNVLLGQPEVATAYHAHSVGLLARAAEVLGHEDDAARYAGLRDRVVAAYQAEFVGPDGRMRPHRQAPYVRALALGLAPEHLRDRMAAHLVGLVRDAGHHVGTGFLSTGMLLPVLTDHGYLDDAYRLLLQTTRPSWLYQVDRGATTVWERWDAVREDGAPHSSLNHYSPGAVADWLHRVVAGLDLDEPGYRRALVRPRPGGGLRWAQGSLETPQGELRCRWERGAGRLRIAVTVPPNAEARVVLPGARLGDVAESGRPVDGERLPPGLLAARQDGSDAELLVAAGRYELDCPDAAAVTGADPEPVPM